MRGTYYTTGREGRKLTLSVALHAVLCCVLLAVIATWTVRARTIGYIGHFIARSFCVFFFVPVHDTQLLL